MTEVGSVYGGALYELAADEQLDQVILDQLLLLEDSFSQEPDFLKLLSSHNLSKQERCQILDSSFGGKLHPYVLNFIKILTEKSYIRYFSHCCTAFRERYNERHNILPVTAVTAIALTQEQTVRLEQKLTAMTGKTIQLTNRVDESCLGGVRLDYDGKRLDDTVAHRLESLRSLLRNTVL